MAGERERERGIRRDGGARNVLWRRKTVTREGRRQPTAESGETEGGLGGD
jgi:hypothetical protein